MRQTVVTLLLLIPLTVVSAGCGDVLDRVDDLRGSAEQVTDRARFCLALARTVTAIEAGAPDTASEAAEEALATAPDDVIDDARAVAQAIREARDRGDAVLDDPSVRDAADQLERRTREQCDPTSS